MIGLRLNSCWLFWYLVANSCCYRTIDILCTITFVLHCDGCPALSRLSCAVTFVLHCHVCPVLSRLSCTVTFVFTMFYSFFQLFSLWFKWWCHTCSCTSQWREWFGCCSRGIIKLLENNQWRIFHIFTSEEINDVIYRFLHWIYITKN